MEAPPTPPVALGRLLADGDLGLRRLAGPAEAEVHGVHASEMADPSRYLLGGELLLTAGEGLAGAEAVAGGGAEAVAGGGAEAVAGGGAEAVAGGGAEAVPYVERLVRAGVAAVGFGVTPVHETVPRALVEACARHGLPLVEVPPATPFTAVGRAVWRLMEEARTRELRRVTEAQQSLAAAAARPDPVPALLARLSASLSGWAALLTPASTPDPGPGPGTDARPTPGSETTPPPGPPGPPGPGPGGSGPSGSGPSGSTPAGSTPAAGRGAGPGGPESAGAAPASGRGAGAVVAAQGTGRGARPSGSTPAGSAPGAGRGAGPGGVGPAGAGSGAGAVGGPGVVGVVGGIGWGVVRSAGGVPRAEVRAAVDALARRVAPGSAATATDTLAGTHLSAYAVGGGQVLALATPVRAPGDHTIASVAAVLLTLLTANRPAGDEASALTRLLLGGDPARALAPGPWHVVHARGTGDPQALGAALGTVLLDPFEGGARLLTDREPVPQPGWRLGVSAPAAPGALATADAQAARALDRAEAARTPLARHSDPGLAGLVGEAEARAHAEALLGPLSPVLRDTLRGWLAHHGGWDRTAADLGVHRNTVRQRVARCAELLGRDLDDPDVRMELWFALRRPEPPAAGTDPGAGAGPAPGTGPGTGPVPARSPRPGG
ncbi:PucR family transcriptional regulator [Streptomyces sp. NPDC048270]|uniref:PucR family transcriptional regulator n=1 Tax=Streptomyces sp. NPDC048270 TaxID=3154615 RepID=UPI0033EA9053